MFIRNLQQRFFFFGGKNAGDLLNQNLMKYFKIPYHPVYTATKYDDGKFGKKMIIFTYALFVYHIF